MDQLTGPLANLTIEDLRGMQDQLANMGDLSDAEMAELKGVFDELLNEEGSGDSISIGGEIFEGPEAQELLEQMAAIGFGMMMQFMAQTMQETQKVAMM